MSKKLDPARKALEGALAANEGEREESIRRLKSELGSRKRTPRSPAKGKDAAAASAIDVLRKALGG